MHTLKHYLLATTPNLRANYNLETLNSCTSIEAPTLARFSMQSFGNTAAPPMQLVSQPSISIALCGTVCRSKN